MIHHLSTHDLTQRSTTGGYDNSGIENTFQLTTSRRGRHISDLSIRMYESFQLTTSRRGRRRWRFGRHVRMVLSTHDLTQRSTRKTAFYILGGVFQLTTSRRGRQKIRFCSLINIYLSTHDLTQRSTVIQGLQEYLMNLSTHDLTQRSTSTTPVLWSTTKTFNSRPHAEVD